MITKSAKVWLGGAGGITLPITISQYDTGWEFAFSVYNGSVLYNPGVAVAVTLEGDKPDGTAFSIPGTFADGMATFDGTSDIAAAAGTVACELRVSMSGETVGTANFDIIVEEAPLAQHVTSEDNFAAMQALLDDVSEEAAAAAQSATDAASAAGTAAQTVLDQAPTMVSNWLEEHVDPDTGYVIDNSLTVAGAAADAKATGDGIAAVNDTISNLTGVETINFTKDYYIKTNEATVDTTPIPSSTGFAYAIVNCSEGDVFTINGQGGSTPRLWCFIDAANNVLSVSDENVTRENLLLLTPTNASKLIINDNSGQQSYKGVLLRKRSILPTNTDLDTIVSEGKYQIASSCTYLNAPMASITAELYVYSYYILSNNTTVITQVITRPSPSDPMIFTRSKFGNNNWTSWGKISNTKPYESFESTALYPDSYDLNDITTPGIYTTYSGGSYLNYPLTTVLSGVLTVSVDDRDSIWQIYTVNTTGAIFTRNKVRNQWSSWHSIYFGNGLNILLLGDSIFGNDGEIASFMAEQSASCVNGAFGGTRVTVRDSGDFQYFDGVNLITALTTQDWTNQDAAAASLASTYSWITSRLAGLKAVDMSDIDVIIMDWGTNDYTASKTIEQINSAYNTVIDLLQTTYPTIRLLITTPIWRYWGDPEDNENGDNKVYNVSTLKEIASAIEQNAKDKRITVFNAYQNVPLSYATASSFYDVGDTTHLNSAGNKVYAGYLLGKLKTMY